MQNVQATTEADCLFDLPPFRREPIVLPKGRFEQYCSWLSLVACIGCFAWALPRLIFEYQNDIDGGMGFIATWISGSLSFIALLWCRESHRRWNESVAAEKEIAARPKLAYRMALPAARVAGDHLTRQFRYWRWFPYVDAGISLVIGALFHFDATVLTDTGAKLQTVAKSDTVDTSGPAPDLAEIGTFVSAAVLFLIVAFRVAGHLHVKLKILNVSAEEICLFSVPASAQVGISYQGRLTLMGSAGSRNANNPRGSRQSFLGGSQLIGSLQDPEDPTTPIISWDLKLFVGSWNHHGEFEVESIGVPVDCSKARDFVQWLSKEPIRNMFGFVGKAAKSCTSDNVCHFPNDYVGFVQRASLPLENGYQFGQTLVLTAHMSYKSSNLLAVSLISLGGRVVLELQASPADRIADFCHTVSTKDECPSNQVQIVLPDGRSLSDMNGMATLETFGL